jgi:exopolyphosphatase/guanosine-5'-triphosphate,3'-diphosphate pyrophosphatase
VIGRVAAIDCGTNSIRLLIADGSASPLVDVVREMRIVRLGEGVDRTGVLSAAALERTRSALIEYADLIAEHGAEAVRMVATSATRDAANRDEFSTMVLSVLGIAPEVITGTDEAALSFLGAASAVPDPVQPLLVADIGGGSTELVMGEAPDRLQSYSMDVGCVRMTERHLHDDPPTAPQIAAARADVRAALAQARSSVAFTEAAMFVGVAGTVTTMSAIALGLTTYDAEAIHGSRMSAATVDAVAVRLLAMTHAERAALPVMHPGRVDVIGGGALVLQELMHAIGCAEVVVSEHDILDGIALSLLPVT